MSLAPDDPRHGTVNGYTNLGCRCDRCRRAWADYFLVRKQRRGARLTDDDPRHGLRSTYSNHGCRCDACRIAGSVYQKALRKAVAP